MSTAASCAAAETPRQGDLPMKFASRRRPCAERCVVPYRSAESATSARRSKWSVAHRFRGMVRTRWRRLALCTFIVAMACAPSEWWGSSQAGRASVVGNLVHKAEASPGFTHLHAIVCFCGMGLGFLVTSQACREGDYSHIPNVSQWAWFQHVLVLIYVGSDLGNFLAVEAAPKTYIHESVMFITSLISWVLSVSTTYVCHGAQHAREACSMERSVRLLPISLSFSLAMWFQLHAVSRLDGLLVKVLSQMKLPVTVMMSTVWLRRSYNVQQTLALARIFLGIVWFTLLRVNPNDVDASITADRLQGFIYTGLAVFFSVTGSLLSEQALQGTKDKPMHVTVAHLKVGETLLSFCWLSLMPGSPVRLSHLLSWPRSSLLRGFDLYTWLVIMLLVADGWTSASVVRHLSSVVKVVVKCLSMVLLFLISVIFFKTEVFTWLRLALVCVVTQGMWAFSNASRATAPQPPHPNVVPGVENGCNEKVATHGNGKLRPSSADTSTCAAEDDRSSAREIDTGTGNTGDARIP